MDKIQKYLNSKFDGNNIWQSNYRQWDFDMILKHGKFVKDDIILDTGALHSYFSVYLARFVKKVYTTDDLSWAERDYFAKSGLPAPAEWIRVVEEKGKGKIIAERADVTELPYKDETFDNVLSISTIEHVVNDEKAITETFRVLKRGGKFLLTTEFNDSHPKEYSEKDGSYYRIYDMARIKHLLRNFKIQTITEQKKKTTERFTTLFISAVKNKD